MVGLWCPSLTQSHYPLDVPDSLCLLAPLSTCSMYGRLDPKPVAPSYSLEERLATEAAQREERRKVCTSRHVHS